MNLVAAWYREQRVEGVDLYAAGDMLLFQWGTLLWHQGMFAFDLTRQFISTDEVDDCSPAGRWPTRKTRRVV